MKADLAPASRMEKVVHIYRLGEEPDDAAFWQTQSVEARLAALESIRCEYHGWDDEARPEFRRIHTVLKR